jgi:hypothetical protein
MDTRRKTSKLRAALSRPWGLKTTSTLSPAHRDLLAQYPRTLDLVRQTPAHEHGNWQDFVGSSNPGADLERKVVFETLCNLQTELTYAEAALFIPPLRKLSKNLVLDFEQNKLTAKVEAVLTAMAGQVAIPDRLKAAASNFVYRSKRRKK